MGSLVVKIDSQTSQKIRGQHHYSDVDVFRYSSSVDGDLSIVYDVDAVKQSVRNILTWRVGESVISPAFGHNIHRSMYEQLDTSAKERISQEIQRAIEDNEPRVKVDAVATKLDENDEGNALRIRVVYHVVGNRTEDAKIVDDVTISGK